MSKKLLKPYQSKREFNKTPEPQGRISKKHKNPLFVVHKHDARSLHYDFRLEDEGVLKSWAIPKGPTLDPTVKRLAMHVNDHDLEYRHFEGIIPEGGYGAGTVMIWDEGTYIPEVEISKGIREPIEDKEEGIKVMKNGLEKGEIKFILKGKKLKGSFALVKTHGFGPKNSWLLIKHDDKYSQKGYDSNDFDFSATTKRTMAQISQASD